MEMQQFHYGQQQEFWVYLCQEYLESKKQVLDQNNILSYVKDVSKFIIENIGGTEFGPAASFRDIAKAIANNTGEVLPVATPRKFQEIPEPTFVGLPVHLGSQIGTSLFDDLSENERAGIREAAKAIYQTYRTAIENIE